MTTSAPTFSQIRAQVAAIKKQQGYDHTGVFGIHSPARWTGESRHHYGDETYEIVQCDSELAMRVALQEVDDKVTAKVLVTNLSTDQLSTDVRVRLARRKVYAIKKWQIVKELFQAKQSDPRIAGQNWIAERLLDPAPPDHYPPVAGGVLDADTVWGILLEREIGMPLVRPDLIALLKWSMDRGNVKQFCDAGEDFRQAACTWLAQSSGIATAAVLACLEKTKEPMAVTVGLALAVTTNPSAKSQLKTAAVRIEERYTGAGKLTDAVADAWQHAATNLVRLHLPETKQRGEWLTGRERYFNRRSRLGDSRELTASLFAMCSRFATCRIVVSPNLFEIGQKRVRAAMKCCLLNVCSPNSSPRWQGTRHCLFLLLTA